MSNTLFSIDSGDAFRDLKNLFANFAVCRNLLEFDTDESSQLEEAQQPSLDP